VNLNVHGLFCFNHKGVEMSEKTAKGEMPETETQAAPEAEVPEPEEFDKERAMKTIAQLREIEKKGKADARRLAELEKSEQSRIDAERSELEKAQARADKAEAEAKAIRIALLRRDAATKAKLPAELADRLKGETLEELEADAAELLKVMPKQVAPKLEPTNPSAPQKGETEAEKRKRLLG
jgi:hypothetical protein